jgi:hypothetical protein
MGDHIPTTEWRVAGAPIVFRIPISRELTTWWAGCISAEPRAVSLRRQGLRRGRGASVHAGARHEGGCWIAGRRPWPSLTAKAYLTAKLGPRLVVALIDHGRFIFVSLQNPLG